jgi:hypothetical protein
MPFEKSGEGRGMGYSVVSWGVYAGICRMPTCQLFKVALTHLQKVGARAYVHLDFCDKSLTPTYIL